MIIKSNLGKFELGPTHLTQLRSDTKAGYRRVSKAQLQKAFRTANRGAKVFGEVNLGYGLTKRKWVKRNYASWYAVFVSSGDVAAIGCQVFTRRNARLLYTWVFDGVGE